MNSEHNNKSDLQDLGFLKGGGEMGKLIRDKDWNKTIVGNPTEWPQSLRTTLSIILNSKFPMFLFWGPELICFYNDAYRPSLGEEGKHPDVLGSRAEDYWQGIWPDIKPLIDHILAGGDANWSDDQLLPIYRNGEMQDVYWSFCYSPVYDESGIPAGVFVTCTETTEKVNLMKKFASSELRFRSLAEQTPIYIFIANQEAEVTYWNEQWLDFTGLSYDEAIALDWAVIVHPDDYGALLNVYMNAIKKRVNYSVEARIKGKEGKYRWILFTGGPHYYDNHKFDGIVGSGIDIHESKEALQNLMDSELKFRLLAESLPQLVWNSDVAGRPNYFNQSVLKFTGLTIEKLIDYDWLNFVHPEDRNKYLELWQHSLATGEEYFQEIRLIDQEGNKKWFLGWAVPQRNVDGEIQMWVGTYTDIHKIKGVDEHKDYFIGMISHELRNPITTIKGYVQLLESLYADHKDPMLVDSLRNMGKQVENVIQMISELLDLSKIRAGRFTLAKEPFDINNLIKETIEEFRHAHAEVKIEFEVNHSLIIEADVKRIGQVLKNLLSNAIKYAPDSNTITMNSYQTEDMVIISVQDYGIGISEEDQSKIFDKFYRASGTDEKRFAGFGIGLNLVFEIIKAHGGQVSVESELDQGAHFYLSLPILASPD